MNTMLGIMSRVVPQENYIRVIGIFLIYSILGWCVESIYMSICNRKVTNRGFVRGPICPIYGVGEFIVYTLVSPFAGDNYIVIFFVGMILATSLELLTAKAMMNKLGHVWWDYTNKRFNYKGILCLESSLGWGLYTVLEFAFLRNAVVKFANLIPLKILGLAVFLIITYYLYDMALCLRKVMNGEVREQENNLKAFKEKV